MRGIRLLPLANSLSYMAVNSDFLPFLRCLRFFSPPHYFRSHLVHSKLEYGLS